MTLDDVATFPRPGGRVAISPRFTDDGRRLYYLYPRPGTAILDLWCLDLTSGERRTVATAPTDGHYTLEEELRRERQRLTWDGITAYQAVGDVVLFAYGGRLFVGRGGEPPAPVPGTEGALDPKLLPDGRRVVFVRAGEVFLADVATGEARPLLTGARDGLAYGVAEYAAQEELGRLHGHFVSPDGAHVAVTEVDERHMPAYPIVHLGAERPWVETHRYPFVGGPNAHVGLWLVPTEAGAPQRLDYESGDGYLARVAWTPAGELAVLHLERSQRRAEWRLVWPEAVAGRVLLVEESDRWVSVGDTHFLASGEILFTSERTGYRHLYRRRPDGEEVPLTAGAWVVTELLAVDEERRVAFVRGTRETPLERHVYEVPLAGGEPRRLTPEPGCHSAVFSPRCDLFVDQWSDLAQAPTTVVRSTAGDIRAVVHEPQETADSLGVRPPELIVLPGADGTPLYAAVYRPVGESEGPHPLVVSVYGGPLVQTVQNAWDLTSDLRAQYLAQHGVMVLKVDGRGSFGRGLVFEAPVGRRFGTVEVEDQVAGVHHAVQELGADPARVGIFGWSYGGYMTLMALLKAPDVFRVGVAGAPVADWRWYDTAYTERYMATPEENPEGYRQGSVLPFVDRLQGRLLLIHGLVDENVHFRHTARIAQALVEAGKTFELAVLPESRHQVRGFAEVRFVAERTLGFLLEHLQV